MGEVSRDDDVTKLSTIQISGKVSRHGSRGAPKIVANHVTGVARAKIPGLVENRSVFLEAEHRKDINNDTFSRRSKRF